MPTQKTLSQFSDDDLQKELNRRQIKRETPPNPLPKPDWEKFQKYIEDTVAQAVSGSQEGGPWWDDDSDHYIFEQAMMTVYGPLFFDWYNQVFNQ